MTTLRRETLLDDVRTLYDTGVAPDLTDGELLDRFGRRGADAGRAFSALVARHGPLVLRVCRSALADPHDADDAFQATFLVLLRKAGTIRRRSSCASWLHGVALRASAEIRANAARRKAHERRAADAKLVEPERTEPPGDDLRRVIDEELAQLHDRDRAPIVLCDLEGRSCEEAARRLGWPLGTVKSRLSRGRARLRDRLARRGIDPALAAALPPARLAVPPALAGRVAEALAGNPGISAAAATAAAALTRLGPFARLGRVALALLLGAGFVAGLTIASGTDTTPEPQNQAPADTPAKAEEKVIHVVVQDRDGAGVPGIEVLVYRFDERPSTFKTGPDGRLRIPRPAAGIAPLLARRGGELAWGHFDQNVGFPFPQGTPEHPIVMTLLRLNRTLEGTVADARGNPIAKVRVAVDSLGYENVSSIYMGQGPSEAVWGSPLGAAVTDARGRYLLTLPDRARGGLRAEHPNFVTTNRQVAADAEAIDPLTLEPAGAIVGTVTDEAGRPVAKARLGAQRLDRDERAVGVGFGEAISDDRGRFAVRGLEAGVYNLHAWQVPGRERATARAVEGVRVRAGEDAAADLGVVEGRAVRGVVIDALTDRPAPDVLVNCQGPAAPRSGSSAENRRTDDRGRFTFYVPPGEQYVYLMEPSMNRLNRATVAVPERGEPGPVRLVKNAGVPNRFGPVFAPAVKAEVKKEGATGGAKPVAVDAGAKPVAVTEVTKAAPKSTPAVVVRKRVPPEPKLAGGKTVTGLVTDAQGKPVPGVRVFLNEPVGQGGHREAASDRQGVFIIEGLPKREISFHFSRADDPPATVKVAADQTTVDHVHQARRDAHDAPMRAPQGDEPLPSGLQGRLTFAGVDRRGNEFLADGPGGSGNDLDRLPRGVHKLGGTYFRVGEKLVHLRGKQAPTLPVKVDGIAVGAKADVLHFLHAGQNAEVDGAKVAEYTVRYADGTAEAVPIVEGKQTANWWRFPLPVPDDLPDAKLAWVGTNDTLDLNRGIKARLFVFDWVNPHPDREIASVGVASTDTGFDPFVVAITAERTGAGAP